MSYSFKGSLSFGLVYIPVTLHSTIKNNDIGFNMIDKKTMSRVKYQKTCVDCGDRIVK
ncbi:MAG: Ku protein, partial [Christensenellales bacterium]